MTVAVPMEPLAGEIVGALIAEVNLTYVRDVVSGIAVGKAGYAYVVSPTGDLIAHPDLSFVLEKRNMRELGQVRAALAGTPGVLPPEPSLTGQRVLPAFAPIPGLGWAVVVERPLAEAYAPLYGSILRTSILVLVGPRHGGPGQPAHRSSSRPARAGTPSRGGSDREWGPRVPARGENR